MSVNGAILRFLRHLPVGAWLILAIAVCIAIMVARECQEADDDDDD